MCKKYNKYLVFLFFVRVVKNAAMGIAPLAEIKNKIFNEM